MSCPVCHKPPAPRYRPFCSRRCADVDLARWLGGRHVLPGPPVGHPVGPHVGGDPEDEPG